MLLQDICAHACTVHGRQSLPRRMLHTPASTSLHVLFVFGIESWPVNQELSVSLNPSSLPRPSPRVSRFRAVVSDWGGRPGRWHTWLESEKHCRPLPCWRLGSFRVLRFLEQFCTTCKTVEIKTGGKGKYGEKWGGGGIFGLECLKGRNSI
jgi:hypothetical protein